MIQGVTSSCLRTAAGTGRMANQKSAPQGFWQALDQEADAPAADKTERYAYHPSYIGEMTQDEWEQLLRKTDRGIQAGKEESRRHGLEQAEKAKETAQDRRTRMQQRLAGDGKKYVPYAWLADGSGTIDYHGVRFFCDTENGALCLGDVSAKNNVLSIPLSGGGVLRCNLDQLPSLAAAIGMFSPEDVNRILRAVAQAGKLKEMQQELEEEKASIGKSAEEHLDQEAGIDTDRKADGEEEEAD